MSEWNVILENFHTKQRERERERERERATPFIKSLLGTSVPPPLFIIILFAYCTGR